MTRSRSIAAVSTHEDGPSDSRRAKSITRLPPDDGAPGVIASPQMDDQEGPPTDGDSGAIQRPASGEFQVVIPAPWRARPTGTEFPYFLRVTDAAEAARVTRLALTVVAADPKAMPASALVQAALTVAAERKTMLQRLREALELEDEAGALAAAAELVGLR
jgi:hypothetical protein